MVNYFVIAKYNGTNWEANLYNRDLNPSIFDLIVENSRIDALDLDDLNCFNVVTGQNYKVTDEVSYENFETIIRRIGFRKCDDCGCWVTPQDIYLGLSVYDRNEGKRRCQHCQQQHENEQRLAEARRRTSKKLRLAGYHNTSDEVRVINGEGESFDLSNVLGIGIEMEFNSGNCSAVRDGYIQCTDEFYEDANPRSSNRIWRCEQDCTVEGEIISNVFTKKALYAYDWNRLTDELKRKLHNNEGIRNVGLHTHLTKFWLGANSTEQCINFLKLQYFLKSYEEDFLKMSGRKREEMTWCNFFSYEEIESMKNHVLSCNERGLDAWSCMPCDHHHALISSRNTIELRIGKSTNDPVRIEMYLKFVLGVVENIKNVPSEKCYCLNKVTRLVPPEVMAYWHNKGLFLKTTAIENRGVTL